jgi:hypothetical protein
LTVIAAVDAAGLFEVVWVSLLAGVGITTIFSLVVLYGARSAEARRGGRARAATVYAVVAMLAFALFAGGVVFGVNIMLSKG